MPCAPSCTTVLCRVGTVAPVSSRQRRAVAPACVPGAAARRWPRPQKWGLPPRPGAASTHGTHGTAAAQTPEVGAPPRRLSYMIVFYPPFPTARAEASEPDRWDHPSACVLSARAARRPRPLRKWGRRAAPACRLPCTPLLSTSPPPSIQSCAQRVRPNPGSGGATLALRPVSRSSLPTEAAQTPAEVGAASPARSLHIFMCTSANNDPRAPRPLRSGGSGRDGGGATRTPSPGGPDPLEVGASPRIGVRRPTQTTSHPTLHSFRAQTPGEVGARGGGQGGVPAWPHRAPAGRL